MLKTSHVFCGDKFVKVVSSVEMKQKMDESILHIIGVYRTVFGLFVCLFFLSLFFNNFMYRFFSIIVAFD